jgi:hypothetical protein
MAGGGSSNFTYDMFSLGGEYRFFQDRISVHAEYRSTSADGKTFDNLGNVSDYSFSRSHYRVGGLYQISPGQTIVADANILLYDGSFESYTDQIFRLRYERFF